MDLVKELVSPEDAIELARTNPYTTYDCSKYTKCRGFTLLHRLVLLTGKYPELNNVIRNYIIREPREVNKVNKKGWSALHLAVRNCGTLSSIEVIKILLDNGANVNHQINDGETPLMFSVRYLYESGVPVTKLLLEYGAVIDLQDVRGGTALLHSVCCDLYNPCIKLLLDNGANVNIKDNDGCTTLMFLAKYLNKYNSIGSIKLLLDYGANTNIQNRNGYTALMIATKYLNKNNNIEVIKLLLEYDASTNIQNIDGKTALMFAIKYFNNSEFSKLLKLLIDYGADVSIQDKNKDTFLHMLMKQPCNYIVTNALHNIKLDFYAINKKDIDGNVACTYAIFNNNIDAVNILLKYCSVNTLADTMNPKGLKYTRCWKGFTFFMIAAQEGHIDMAKLLLNKGCDINMQNDEGNTALHLATLKCNSDMIDLLLSTTMCLDIKNKYGQTALHIAIGTDPDNFDIVKKFINVGFSLHIEDDFGNTPLDYYSARVRALI